MNEITPKVEDGQPPAETEESRLHPKRRAILVLGMHRSGTSAVAGVLNALGTAAPKTIMGPTIDNPSGYFESVRLADAFDRMLAAAGTRWHDWRQLDPQWFHSVAAQEHHRTISELFIDEFGDAPMIVVKDPRICRFVPLILSILAELHIDPVAVVPIRNPLEVAQSLKRRNNFVLPKSILLWLRHTLDAEFYSRQMPRFFLRYEDFLYDWRHFAARAAKQMNVVWPDHSDSSDAKIAQFLASDLRRENASLEEIGKHPYISPMVMEAYHALIRIVADGQNPGILDRLDLIRSEFNDGCRIFGAAVSAEETATVNGLINERDDLTARYNRLMSERDALKIAYDNLLAEHGSHAASHRDRGAGCEAFDKDNGKPLIRT